jgi:hypothetical protein
LKSNVAFALFVPNIRNVIVPSEKPFALKSPVSLSCISSDRKLALQQSRAHIKSSSFEMPSIFSIPLQDIAVSRIVRAVSCCAKTFGCSQH